MDSSYRRSRSQSRFPPIDEHPGGYPTQPPLDRSHRSKSLDNRRDFVPEDDYDPYRSIERNSTFHASLGRRPPRGDGYRLQHQGGEGGGDFFNETITIPTAHTKAGSKHRFDDRQKHEDADDDWTSYDRQVKYHTERTAYPVNNTRRTYEESYIQPRAPLYYEDYSYRSGPPAYPPELSPHSAVSRYPESDYYQQRRMDQGQQYLRKEDSLPYVPPSYAQHEQGYDREHGMAAESAAVSAATAARTGAGAGRSGGHQSYRYHHESHGGGGASGKARYGQSNGFASNYQEKRMGGGYYEEKRSRGGLFGGRRRKDAAEAGERVYHRIHCCCFSFKWPPFAYEECEPPRPMYPKPPKDSSPMPIRHQPPPPSQY